MAFIKIDSETILNTDAIVCIRQEYIRGKNKGTGHDGYMVYTRICDLYLETNDEGEVSLEGNSSFEVDSETLEKIYQAVGVPENERFD